MNELTTQANQLKLLSGSPTPTYQQWIDHVGDGWVRGGGSFLSRWNDRELYTKVSWFIVCQELADLLAEQFKGKKVADLGCGSGFLVNELRKRGVDIVGYDKREGHTFNKDFVDDIIFEDFTQVDLSGYDVLLSCWPTYTSNAMAQIVPKMCPGQYLYYEGESQGGCTADDEFFDAVEEELISLDENAGALNRFQPTWDGIHDRWEVYYRQDRLVITSSQHAVE